MNSGHSGVSCLQRPKPTDPRVRRVELSSSANIHTEEAGEPLIPSITLQRGTLWPSKAKGTQEVTFGGTL